jgi:hypothetical protein
MRSARANAWSLYPVALHNLGVEQEFLGQLDAARATYLKGCCEAEDRLGPDHPVTVKIRLSFAEAEDSARRVLREFGTRSR